MIVDTHLVGRQLYGKLVVKLQGQFPAYIKGLIEDHPSIKLCAYRHILIKDLQSAEHRTLLTLILLQQRRIDNIQTTLSAYQHLTVTCQPGRALVIGSLLQTIAAVEAADCKLP